MKINREQAMAIIATMALIAAMTLAILFATIVYLTPPNEQIYKSAISLEGNTININCTQVMSNISRYGGDIAFKVDGQPAIRIYLSESCSLFAVEVGKEGKNESSNKSRTTN